jgi:pimeloyl-ACP methyl ester carboxylesterase
MEAKRDKPSFGQRWSDARPTKTVLFWSCVASMVLTMIVGFSWGGWVTGGTARQTAENMARDAVVARLALKDESTWQRAEYVGKQGWATMPGEREPDRRVAEACAALLIPGS